MGEKPKPAVRPWLWIVLIIVILAGGGVFWYYYYGPGKTTTTTTPTTTDETASWQSYKNETYGFSIKYPTNYTVTEAKENSIVFNEKNASGEGYAPLNIGIEKTSLILDKAIQDKEANKINHRQMLLQHKNLFLHPAKLD